MEGSAGRFPVISLVGRANVGKSTLFNRLTRSKQALVTEIPGTTRDRKEGLVSGPHFAFILVDTGGMGFDARADFSGEVDAQIQEAIELSDCLWMLVDVTAGLNPFDEALYRLVQRSNKPHLVLANKADNVRRSNTAAEFYALGCGSVHPISAAHGSGIDEVLERTSQAVTGLVRPEDSREDSRAQGDVPNGAPVRVAFLGRPNVGKSSLVNRIMGQSRMIVSEIAGTTREAVEIPFMAEGREYLLVDTAGIRRKARTTEFLEKIGVLQSLGALNRVDVAVLVLDAAEQPAMQDARIARYIVDHERAVVIAINKSDLVKGGKAGHVALEETVHRKLRFIDHAALVRTNALSGQGLGQLFREIDRAAKEFRRKIQTADLNRVVQAAMLRFPPPAKGRSQGKVFYGLQTGASPPTFRFFANHPKQITAAYTRFFENQLRFHFGFKGVPLRIQWRDRDGGDKREGRLRRDGNKKRRGGTPTKRKS